MPFSDLLGIIFGLTSAAVWGAGDYCGGFAARRKDQFQVLALSAFSGILVLLVFALWRGEPLPSTRGIMWSIAAGVSGAMGLAALYRGLSLGHAATVAPTSAVISAALPVIFGVLTQGPPGAPRLLGFALALLGVWLVSQSIRQDRAVSRQGLLLACVAGVGFGGFLIFMAQVEPGLIFTPLAVERGVILLVSFVLVSLRRSSHPWSGSNPPALLAGMLDAGGNIFYMLARQYTRLDVAAVLSSLYPASTVLLAYLLLKEKVTPTQWFGVTLCLAAIALITV